VQASHLFEAQTIQAAKSPEQNYGVRVPRAGVWGLRRGQGCRPWAHLRLPIVDCRFANFLAVAAQAELFEIRNSTGPKEMLKMKEPPGMYMKTKEGMTKCPAKSTPFSTKMHELRATLHEPYRFVGQRCSNSAVIETKWARCSVPRASCP
jgi:hypothetical protein